MDTNKPDREPEPDPALDYELPASFALCCTGSGLAWKNDEIAQFPTANAAIDYGRREMDSFYVVCVQTGEVVANQCLHDEPKKENA
jgi:hypothetical protein